MALYSRLWKSCSDLLGLTRHNLRILFYVFQVFDNVLLNLKVMKLKVDVHSLLDQALNQSLFDDFLHTLISCRFFSIFRLLFLVFDIFDAKLIDAECQLSLGRAYSQLFLHCSQSKSKQRKSDLWKFNY